MDDNTVLQRRLDRALKEVSALETIIEDRSRSLFTVQDELRQVASFLSRVLETLSNAVFVFGPTGDLIRVNGAGHELLGIPHDFEKQHYNLVTLLVSMDGDGHVELLATPQEHNLRHLKGHAVPVLLGTSRLESPEGELESTVCVAVDIREQKRLEIELSHAHKLESVGQLAAGVAHEINTPIQFLGDSITFLRESFEDTQQYWQTHECITAAAAAANIATELRTKLASLEEEINYEFLKDEIPAAFVRCADGIERVTRIVSAMKEFAHPGDAEMSLTDINRSIETTITVARNEYKYIAEVEKNFGEFPHILCHAGDINQVILNLIINAAHAIQSRQVKSPGAGTIGVTTVQSSGAVTISISDNGAGIPKKVRARIFDPFFTTKEVGRGTGQGLSLAHNVVVDRHGGEIWFDTEIGVGTTFHIRLPQPSTQTNDAA